MSFEKSIREDFSDIPVLFFLGGEGTRMEDLAYKHILPSKQWLPIGFDENNEPIPLFWRNFEILFELGFREFYILVNKDEEKVKKYFEKKIRGPNVNILLLNKENISERVKVEGLNIYIFKQKEKGTGNALVEIKEAISGRLFLEMFGDEYFGGEKEKIKKELTGFINFAIKKAKQNGTLKVEAFVEKEKVISKIGDEEKRYILKEDEQVDITKNSNLVVTSLSLSSPSIINIFEKKGIKDFNTFEAQQELIKTYKIYGKIIDLIFANINTKEGYLVLMDYLINTKIKDDYLALLVYTINMTLQNKNNKLLKLR
jgi:NDP-sugar pyrophosphorylase family protein